MGKGAEARERAPHPGKERIACGLRLKELERVSPKCHGVESVKSSTYLWGGEH